MRGCEGRINKVFEECKRKEINDDIEVIKENVLENIGVKGMLD